MRITLRDIEAFAAVYENRSFKDASVALAVSPPALTRRVQKLEQTLGVQLLERTTRAIVPTKTGTEFYRRTHEVIEDLEATVMSFENGTQHRSSIVSVACVRTATGYFLLDAIEKFHEAFPDVRVRIFDGGATDCVTTVLNGEADFGISFAGNGEPGVNFEPLLNDPFVLVCAASHPLASRVSVAWAELSDHRCAAAYKGSSNRLFVDMCLSEWGLQVPWFYEARHTLTTLNLAERGLAVAALPRSALPRRSNPALAIVPLTSPDIHRSLGLITPKKGQRTAASLALLNLVTDMGNLK